MMTRASSLSYRRNTAICSSNIEILAENEHWLAINKPIGLPMHKEEDQESVLDVLSRQLNEVPLFPVHRLDKVTSGVLLLGKTREATSVLSQQFQQKTVQKYYLAWSTSKPKKKHGQIKGDMEKSRGGSWKLTRTMNNPAVTQFTSIAHPRGGRLFLMKPTTGKTHQLRVALKSLGSPIHGDERYGGASCERVYLHSMQLEFLWDDKIVTLRSVPEFCEQILKQDKPQWLSPENIKFPGD